MAQAYDGLAIARAVLEDVCKGARASDVDDHAWQRLPGVEDTVGALDRRSSDLSLPFVQRRRRAYGVQVARLAGLPWVADRAADARPAIGEGRTSAPPSPTRRPGLAVRANISRLDGVGLASHREVATDLRDLDLDALTPRQALVAVQQARLEGRLQRQRSYRAHPRSLRTLRVGSGVRGLRQQLSTTRRRRLDVRDRPPRRASVGVPASTEPEGDDPCTRRPQQSPIRTLSGMSRMRGE
ncbi:MAG: hypothetical protein WKH64_14355 [Chloroflexia bacterium]